MRTRRWTWLMVVAVIAALSMSVAACGGDDDGGGGGSEQGGGGGTSAEGTQELEVLLSFPESIAWAPLLVAREKGYFKDEGISIKTQETEGSGFVTQQVIAGNADYGWAAGDSIIVAASKEPDIRAVACNQEQNIFRIVTLEGSEVQSVEDLRGKTLGFTEKGGGEEPLVQSTIADAGLGDEVKLLPIGAAGPQSRRAIEDGQVDAYASSYPDIATLTAQGLKFRDITPDKFSRTPGDCLVIMKDTLADPKKRENIVKMGRAWAKGAVFSIENPSAALELSCPSVPEECKDRDFAQEFMAQTVDLLTPLDTSVPPAGIDLEGWKTTAQVLKDVGTIDKAVDVEQTVNSPEVQEVVKEIQDFDADAVKQDAEQGGGGS